MTLLETTLPCTCFPRSCPLPRASAQSPLAPPGMSQAPRGPAELCLLGPPTLIVGFPEAAGLGPTAGLCLVDVLAALSPGQSRRQGQGACVRDLQGGESIMTDQDGGEGASHSYLRSFLD